MVPFLPRWLRSQARSRHAPPIPLTLYTQPDCPLCEELKAELARVRPSEPFILREIDIHSDPALALAFGRSIPVLLIGEQVAFKGHMRAREFERRYERLASAWRAAQSRSGQPSGEGR